MNRGLNCNLEAAGSRTWEERSRQRPERKRLAVFEELRGCHHSLGTSWAGADNTGKGPSRSCHRKKVLCKPRLLHEFLNSPKHSSQCTFVFWLLCFLISIFSSQFPKFRVARGLPQFTLHDSPAYKNAQNGYVNERKEGVRASGKASCLGVGCGTRHGNQGKAGTSGCSVGGARQQLSPQRPLSFLPSFCRPPE